MKNSKNLSCLLSYIVEDLYEYSVFFVIYFCILLFFKFNKKKQNLFSIQYKKLTEKVQANSDKLIIIIHF